MNSQFCGNALCQFQVIHNFSFQLQSGLINMFCLKNIFFLLNMQSFNIQVKSKIIFYYTEALFYLLLQGIRVGLDPLRLAKLSYFFVESSFSGCVIFLPTKNSPISIARSFCIVFDNFTKPPKAIFKYFAWGKNYVPHLEKYLIIWIKSPSP